MTAQHWPERWAREISVSRVVILPEVRHFTFEGAPEATVRNFQEWWVEINRRNRIALMK
jgi:hypothetical protein